MRFEIRARGPFSFSASLSFLRGFTPARYEGPAEERLSLAFVAEDGWVPTAIDVKPSSEGIAVEVVGPAREGLRDQVARMFSLDVDGGEFLAIGERDPVMKGLQTRYRGLRPVCHPSAYEAAAWGILSHRIRMAQAAVLKKRMATELGERFVLAGEPKHAFPAPQVLASLESFPGLNELKLRRLRDLGKAALDGVLDGTRLRALPAEEALESLMELPGIGPFTAQIILIRGAGAPDVVATDEPRLRDAVERLYGKGTALEKVAPKWKPFRSWCAVLLRTWLEAEMRENEPGSSSATCAIVEPQTPATPRPRRRAATPATYTRAAAPGSRSGR